VLKVGDKMPDVTLSGWLTDTNKAVHIQDLYKNKVLIIDFWATWCGACLNEFHKLDSLKSVFGDKLEIVAVGYQSKSDIRRFLAGHPQYALQNIPVITDDTVLIRRFPHRALPHMVWIDSFGKVAAFTDGVDVTGSSIRSFIQKGVMSAEQKNDRIDFDFRKPFNVPDSSIIGRSILTRRIKGILSYEAPFGDKPRMKYRMFVSNQSIERLYFIAAYHRETTSGNDDLIVLDVKDSLKYVYPKMAYASYKKSKYFDPENKMSDTWKNDNLYCYDLTLPGLAPDSVFFKYMIQDLNRYFNLNGRFEKRLRNCYVLGYGQSAERHLQLSSDTPKIIYKDKDPIWAFDIPHGLKAQNIKTLVTFLNMTIIKSQVVDETGIDPKLLFDFDLPGLKKGFTEDQWNVLLAPYGLTLKKAARNVWVFVISEN